MKRKQQSAEAPAPAPRRGHPAIIPSQNVPDAPRETVVVAALPDPPQFVAPGHPAPQRATEINVDEAVLNILREEMDEISIRLKRFGIRFDTGQQQELVDYAFAILGGFVQGGTLAAR